MKYISAFLKGCLIYYWIFLTLPVALVAMLISLPSMIASLGGYRGVGKYPIDRYFDWMERSLDKLDAWLE